MSYKKSLSKAKGGRPGAVSPTRDAGNAISRMPRGVRDEVSRALADGATWRDIKKICKEHGYDGVRAQNVTNYRKNAHVEWLRREERIEALRRDSDATAEIIELYVENGGSPAEAGLLTAAEMMSQALIGIGPAALKKLIADDPKAIFGMTREMARIAELLQTKRQAKDAPETVPGESTLTPEEENAKLVAVVDRVLGLRH